MTIIFIYIALLSGIFSTENPELTIHINNIENLEGSIIIGVFDKDLHFLEEGFAIANYKIPVNKKNETIIITDLPNGNYAVSLYHDENSDGICNRNFIGIPKEPYGFSNNIKPKFSAPSFGDCEIALNQNLVLTIKLIH